MEINQDEQPQAQEQELGPGRRSRPEQENEPETLAPPPQLLPANEPERPTQERPAQEIDDAPAPDLDAPLLNPQPPLRRSTRNRNPVMRLDPKMSGKRHAEVTLPMVDTNQNIEPDWDIVTFICMTQMSMKAGLKRFGKQAQDGVSKD
jgi:hypothetical protein